MGFIVLQMVKIYGILLKIWDTYLILMGQLFDLMVIVLKNWHISVIFSFQWDNYLIYC